MAKIFASRQGVAVACEILGERELRMGANRPCAGRCFGFVGEKELWLLGLTLKGACAVA